MITETIQKSIYGARSPILDWPSPHQYRYWSDFIERMKRDGHLILVDVEEETPLSRRVVRLWKDWDSYMIQFFDVGARPIVDLMERYEHTRGIITETVVTEI